MRENIEELIPHRAPFLFVDEIVSATKEEIIATMTFEDKANALLKGSFPDFDYIPGTILIESMAQAGGAGVRLLGVTDGIFALVQIESAQFYAGAKFGEQIRYVVKNTRLSEKIIKQEGKAYIGDKLIFEASWMSIKMGERN